MNLADFRQVLLKGVKNENKSDKAALITRLICISVCLYLAACFVLFSVLGSFRVAGLCIATFCVYVACVVLTYREHTGIADGIYYVTTCAMIIFSIVYLGWDCGVQNFAFSIFLLIYTTNYLPAIHKFVLTAAAILLRLVLYFYHVNNGPYIDLSVASVNTIRIFNEVIVFIVLTITLFIFTNDTLKTEAKLAKYNEKLHKLAEQDPLTKLPNRRSVINYMKECIGKCDSEYVGMCVAMGDIDFFKMINDSYGHDAGDEVLKKLAELFMEYMNGKGMIARWGGEEFLFVFENANLDDASIYMDELLNKVRKLHVLYAVHDITLTMTFGLTDVDVRINLNMTDTQIEANINDAVAEADKKLYMGKNLGRDRLIV